MAEQRKLSSERVREARFAIDPVFLDSPLLVEPSLDRRLGLSLFVKLETENPIRSFKGRGTSLFVAKDLEPGARVVTASAGNFGQGLAYNAARQRHQVVVFACKNANGVKVEAMRRLGAEVILHGTDFDAAKTEARAYAYSRGFVFIEDGASASIAEGAGTIASELTDAIRDLDAVFLSLGNGALATGVGCWFKAIAPNTKIIAVASEGAPCMALSWRSGRVVETDRADTIADGIAVRVPVPFAVASMMDTVDEVTLVADEDLMAAMAVVQEHYGRIVEPAGVAGLAGLMRRRHEFEGARVATVLCGANLTSEQVSAWLPRAA